MYMCLSWCVCKKMLLCVWEREREKERKREKEREGEREREREREKIHSRTRTQRVAATERVTDCYIRPPPPPRG
jgi:hypothetical protein